MLGKLCCHRLGAQRSQCVPVQHPQNYPHRHSDTDDTVPSHQHVTDKVVVGVAMALERRRRSDGWLVVVEVVVGARVIERVGVGHGFRAFIVSVGVDVRAQSVKHGKGKRRKSAAHRVHRRLCAPWHRRCKTATHGADRRPKNEQLKAHKTILAAKPPRTPKPNRVKRHGQTPAVEHVGAQRVERNGVGRRVHGVGHHQPNNDSVPHRHAVMAVRHNGCGDREARCRRRSAHRGSDENNRVDGRHDRARLAGCA